MKEFKKAISVVLSIIMVSTVFAPAFSAIAKDIQYIPIAEFSPLAASVSMPTLKVASVTTPSGKYSYKGKTYYTDGKELYKIIRNNGMARKTSFKLRLASKKKLTKVGIRNTLLDCVTAAASDEFSSSSTDGDYLYWHLASFGLKELPSYVLRNGVYLYDMDMVLAYRDTASEEKQVDSVVASFVSSLKTSGKSDYEIIKAVHDFICDKATYDDNALRHMNSSNIEKYNYAFTSYGALVKGKTVCQGYALAFYRICRELGYKARFVSSDPDEGCHAWNIVELNKKYYFVDCTWNDEAENYDLFLVDYDTIQSKDSFRNKNKESFVREHYLDEDYYETDYFNTNYRDNFAQEDYDETDETLLSNCTVKLQATSYTYDGAKKTPSVTVTAPDGNAVASTEYSVTYYNNTDSGEGKVRLSGRDEYAGSVAHRKFKITPKKATGFTVKSGSRASNSITLQWDKTTSAADGYYIYRETSDGYKFVANISSPSTTTYKVDNLSSGTTYNYKIKEYALVNKRKIFGNAWTYLKTTTAPKTPSVSLTASKGALTAKWKSVKCTGYILQYSTKKNMSGAKSINLSSSSTSKKITKLKKGKKYYVRLRAKYVKTYSSGKTYTYMSKWSKVKSVTVK